MNRFDPTNWIDAQRAAGNARGNVFADILSAAAKRRSDNSNGLSSRIERRIERVRVIKIIASSHDNEVNKNTGGGA